MRHHFQTKQWLPFPREQVFAFFADPANLPPLMPDWQQAGVVRAIYVSPPGNPSADRMVTGKGSVITISFRPLPLLPLRMEWDAYIVEFRWGDYFCDEQVRGPFKYFRHCHRVKEAVRDGMTGSVVSDAVEYELPFGLLGDLADGLAVKRQIRSLFKHRQRMLPLLLSGKS
jgi:ligand-binding SRPBCC domain-containing protein